MEVHFQNAQDQTTWYEFVQAYTLNASLQEKFKKYLDLILQENKKYNITAITTNQGIIKDHFYDSLILEKYSDLTKIKNLVDVGSGGGFPGIPLAIVHSQTTVHLLEVTQKKVQFLQMVVQALDLTNVIIHACDWRTFLRTKQAVDMFTARASLQPKELLRLFKPSLGYQKSMLVYWASKNWTADAQESVFLDRCHAYEVGEKKRSLCFFKSC